MTLHASKLAEYGTDPAAFRRDLVIEAAGRTACLGDVADPFQRDDFEALDGGLMRAVGRDPGERDAKPRAYLERHRGASKTADIATCAVWAVAFAPKAVSVDVYAVDADQARLILDAVRRTVRLNPLLERLLDVQRYAVVNNADGHPGNGSRIEVMSADVASSWGRTPHVTIVDELSHWSEGRGEELWESVVSSAAKRPESMLLAIANAGWTETWPFRVREAARSSELWHFSRMEGFASWIDERLLAEQRELLTPKAYARLWGNEWQEGTGEILSQADLDGCVQLAGPRFRPDVRGDYCFIGSLDLGLRRDSSAFLVLGLDLVSGTVDVQQVHTWDPPTNGEVDLATVERTIRDAAIHCRPWCGMVADAWQAAQMRQRLSRDLRMHIVEPGNSAADRDRRARLLVMLLKQRAVRLYPEPRLMKELARLRIVEKANGLTIEAPRVDGLGHCDAAIALTYALPFADEVIGAMRARKRQTAARNTPATLQLLGRRTF